MSEYDKDKFKSMSVQELRDREAQILTALPQTRHVIHGSIVSKAVKCGKPNCRCANGEGHKGLYLSSNYHGHRELDYITKPWAEWMREGVENYKLLQELILELAEIHLALYKRRKKDG